MSYKSWGDRILSQLDDEPPDRCSLGLTFGRYRIVSASVRGRMHIRKDIPREDAVSVYREGNWLAVAVSDGVGSSRYSRLGASFAVNRVCQNLLDQIRELTSARKGIRQRLFGEIEPGREQLDKAMIEGLRNTADNLKEHVEKLTEELESQEHTKDHEPAPSMATSTAEECDTNKPNEQTTQKVESPEQNLDLPLSNNTITLNDLHCTLLVTILNLKSGAVALAQIGDGLILGLTNDLKAMPLIEPQMPGPTGQTYVITQENWERYCSTRVIVGEQSKGYVTIFLMTDGVADDCQYGPPEDILQRWANDMDAEIRKYDDVEITEERLSAYLTDYQVKGSYDDRTLVAVYRQTKE